MSAPAATSPREEQAEPRQKPRRLTELLLLVLAVGIGVGANVLVDPDQVGSGDPHLLVSGLVLGIGALVLHVVLRLRAKYADPYVLPIVVALNGLGIAMIHRIDLTTDQTAAGSQVVWTAFAMTAACLVLWFLKDHRVLRRITYICLVLSGLLLLLPLLPGLGLELNGARIWISVGGRTFQPGEVAKITLAVFFAGYLSTNRDLILLAGKKIGPVRLPRFRDMAPMFAAWIIAIGVLVFQRDLGSAILFFGLFLAMIYLATSRLSWIVIGLLLVAVGGFFASQTFGHVAARLDSWLNAFDPEVYNRAPGGSGQIVQGLFGLSSGGLFGQGLGQGRPDLVSYANSDMIMTAFGEELGLIGLSAVLVLFFLFVTRGFRAALGTRDSFGKLLAAGLSAVIVLQLFVVVGGVTRLIPLTGLTTPFMSAGGSSLLSNWIIAAIILAISHTARRPVVTGPATEADLAEIAAHEAALREAARRDEEERAERPGRRRDRRPGTDPDGPEQDAGQADGVDRAAGGRGTGADTARGPAVPADTAATEPIAAAGLDGHRDAEDADHHGGTPTEAMSRLTDKDRRGPGGSRSTENGGAS
ncbi:FtsW/RodA/SpoVE family cell cycle protein [Kocuria rosea]|uniref:FtsW/RodA/SpoVE family cell cycle protein n=1 Tax=Kocuria rosea TaxID=1275 RepID=UPI002B2423D2|nr:FtsW/RodA/SpoVE family cell cycle protein [Kocuria rosea]MEB2528162.1 FtsW/RodA/SpoVE family cell cycle protein [Kocuria rosea]MEB2618210.1 FtsW/RodA/SpoVE family cell cycle protein [Kocuria rosea]